MPVEVACFGRLLHSGGTLCRDALPYLLEHDPRASQDLPYFICLPVRLYQSYSARLLHPIQALKLAAQNGHLFVNTNSMYVKGGS